MAKKYFNVGLETSGEVSAGVVTSTGAVVGGTVVSNGAVTGTTVFSSGTVQGSVITDGVASLTQGDLSCTDITATGAISDETATLQGGVLSGVNKIQADNTDYLNVEAKIEIDEITQSAPADQKMNFSVINNWLDNSVTTSKAQIDLRTLGRDSDATYINYVTLDENGLTTSSTNELNMAHGSVAISSKNSIELGIDSVNAEGNTTEFLIYKGATTSTGGTAEDLFKVTESTVQVDNHLKVEPSTSSTRLGVMDNSIAIGSVGKLNSDGLLSGGFPTTNNASQTSSYLHIGHAQDTVDIRSEEVYLFADAGSTGKYTLQEIVDTSATDGGYNYSAYTRDLVWLPPVTSVPSNQTGNLGRVFVAAGIAFTGVHRHVADSVIPIGTAVDLIEGKLVATSQANSTTVVGVVAAVVQSLEGDKTSLGTPLASGETVHVVASVGDTRHLDCQGFNVCNENGDIQPGDLLVTSSTPGYLMKQDDDIMRSKTVGKAMEAVTFDDNGQATGVYGFIYCG